MGALFMTNRRWWRLFSPLLRRVKKKRREKRCNGHNIDGVEKLLHERKRPKPISQSRTRPPQQSGTHFLLSRALFLKNIKNNIKKAKTKTKQDSYVHFYFFFQHSTSFHFKSCTNLTNFLPCASHRFAALLRVRKLKGKEDFRGCFSLSFFFPHSSSSTGEWEEVDRNWIEAKKGLLVFALVSISYRIVSHCIARGTEKRNSYALNQEAENQGRANPTRKSKAIFTKSFFFFFFIIKRTYFKG